ncbi:MAG: FAD-dependent oxidoreductase, partial [Rhizobium sp.]
MKKFDVAVVGGGLAGMVAALALARGGRSVVLVSPAAANADKRTTALMDQSIRFLERLALWEKIVPSAAPLAVMQIIDGTDRLLRAPPVTFRSADVGLDAFGYNIPNAELIRVLLEAVEAEGNIAVLAATANNIDPG